MEQIMKNYGSVLMCGLALTAVFWLFWRKGDQTDAQWSVRKAVAEEFIPQETDAWDGDFAELNTQGAHPAPRITCKYTGALDAGVYAVSDVTEAIDYAGQSVAVQVYGIEGEDAETGVLLEDDGRSLHFLRRGIYLLRLSAEDADGRRTYCEMQVAVNGR